MTEFVNIWSFEHDAWWAASSRGYTTSRKQAGRYTRGVAEEIVRQANLGGTLNEQLIEIPTKGPSA
jgi:hypothetical protein